LVDLERDGGAGRISSAPAFAAVRFLQWFRAPTPSSPPASPRSTLPRWKACTMRSRRRASPG